MRIGFGKYLGTAVLFLTFVVLLSVGTAGSAQAYDAHSPIVILDNVSLASFGLPGTGTEADPFLIQNYEIDGSGGSAIAIYDTDLHIKIRNCLLSDSSWPSAVIQLENVRNVTVENNILVDSYVGVGLVDSFSNIIRNNTFQNHNTAILLDFSDRNFILNNTCVLDIPEPSGRVGIQLKSSNNNSLGMNNCSGNNAGISLTSSHFNTLLANICNDNEGSGIVIDSSLNNTVTENICRGNFIGGIELNSAISATTGNRIDNNNCYGNAVTSEWGGGIFLSASPSYDMSNNTISNNELSGNYYGIWVRNAPKNVVVSNTVHDNEMSGIYISSSSWNHIEANTITGNENSGVWLLSSNHCTVEFNAASGNWDGIYLESSDNNVLQSNVLNGNNFGIYLYDSSYNSISFNECNDGVIDGIYLQYANDNSIANNNCSGNEGDTGISLYCSSLNTLQNNTCNGNNDGISLFSPTGVFSTENVLHNNTCNGNTNNGIYVQDRCNSTTITNNTCNSNSGRGIVISGSINCLVANNTCSGNTNGIWLRTGSESNRVEMNNCSANDMTGLYLSDSNNNLISGNTFNYNTYGISAQASSGNTIVDNDCQGNTNGIYLDSSSNSNTLRDNDLLSNQFGIRILGASNANLVDGGTISSAGLTYGIFIGSSVSNTFNGTTIIGGEYGIYLSNSPGTHITNNTMSGCNNGISSDYSDNLVIIDNDVSFNRNNGMEILNSIGSIIANNTCVANSASGIKADSLTNGRIANNNCSLNGGHGVYLHHSDNNVIANNTCLNNTGDGIQLLISDRNQLVNNTCASPEMFYASSNAGIYLAGSDHNLIANNTCINNGDGLHIYSGEYNTVDGNNLSYNNNYLGTKINIKVQASNNNITNNTCLGSGVGISISSASDIRIEGNIFNDNNVGIQVYNLWHERFVIANNTCNGNGYGIYLNWVSDSRITNNTCEDNGKAGMYFDKRAINNVISNNTIRNNGYLLVDDGLGMAFAGHGLVLDGAGEYDNCYDNIISNNTIVGNRLHGINITSASGNLLYGNVLIGNNGATSVYDSARLQAYDSGMNLWNDTERGNLWGDWTSPDANGDGIVDEAYLIDGGMNEDLLPLAICVTITSPADGFATIDTSVDISGTAVSYYGVDHLTWRNAANDASGDCSGTDAWTATVPLVAGDNFITVTMTDLHGSEAYVTITVVLDVIPPTLVITSPVDGAYVGSSLTVAWTGSDAGSGIAYYLVSIEGMFSDNTTGSSYIINDLAGGMYTFLVSAYDAAGNYLDVSVSFTVDATAPVLTIDSPADDFISTDDSVTVTWTGSDVGSGVDRYEVSWEGGSPVTLLPNAGSYTFTGLSDGTHVLTVTVYDKVGLSATDSVTVLIDTQPPSLTITSPAQGSYLSGGDVTVTWSSSDAGTGVAYCLVSIESQAPTNITGTSYTFNGLVDGTYTVLVRAYDNIGNYRDVTVAFTVDTVAPTLTVTTPTEGQLFNSSAVTVTWTTTDTNPGTVQVRFDSGAWVTANEPQFLKTGLSSGSHTVYIKVTDSAGNFAERSANFTVDTDAPTVWFVSPAEGSLVNNSTGIVEWGAEDVTSSLNNTLVRVNGGEWTDLGAATGWIYSLEDGNHTIEIKVMDLAGNSASATLYLTVDSIAPTAECSPIGDELELDLVVLVEFSEAMNQTSVSIAVSSVTGTLTWEDNAVTFTPSQLLYNTVYSVTVSGKDLAGNEIEVNWTFTTRSVGNITGLILDENGDPVANVTVTAGGEFTSVTDESGRFLFTNLSIGTYLFEVDVEGYQPFSFNATVEQGITVDEGAVEMVPDETVDEKDGDGGSIWLYVIIAMAVLAAAGVAAFVLLRKK